MLLKWVLPLQFLVADGSLSQCFEQKQVHNENSYVEAHLAAAVTQAEKN